MAIPNRFDDTSDDEWPRNWRESDSSSTDSSPVIVNRPSTAVAEVPTSTLKGFLPSVAASPAAMSARPGNAFAQRKELEKQQKLQESSTMDAGEKEDAAIKPTVPPKNPSDAVTPELALPMHKSRLIQPVTPLVTQGDKDKSGRERKDSSANAAHEPEVKHQSAMPEPLFHDNGGKEGKAKGGKKATKYWLNKDKKDEKKSENLPTSSEKAAKVLGGTPSPPKKEKESIEDNDSERGKRRILPKRDTPPSSAPANTEPPEDYRSFIDSATTERDVSSSRQVHSHPGPASKRFHLENIGPNTPTIVPPSWGSGTSSVKQAEGKGADQTPKPSPKSKIQGMMLGDPSTSPTRQGNYGKVGNVELHTHPSIASMRGVIVEEGPATHMRYVPSVESFNAGTHHVSSLPMLQPTVYQPGPYYPVQQPYSPSVYDGPGAWEEMRSSHPDSMPPFTPTNFRFSQGSNLGAGPVQRPAGDRSISTRSYPIMFQGQQVEITPTESRPGSTTYGGFVPTPNHPDFQPAGGPDERLVFHFATMQFQLASEFRKLAMQVTDAKDETVDKVIRRINGMETNLQSSIGFMVKEVKQVTQVISAKGSPSQVNDAVQNLTNITKSLESTLDDLKESIMDRSWPLVIDGSSAGEKKKNQTGNSAAVIKTPESVKPTASVPTPMAAYPTPAHGNPGYLAPNPTVIPPHASSLDPNAFAFTPAFAPGYNALPATLAQPSHSAAGFNYNDGFNSHDVRNSSGSTVSAPMHNLVRLPSDFNYNANYQNQGHYNQGQGLVLGGYDNNYNIPRGNDDFYRQHGTSDYRNVSVSTAIHTGEPEPDIRSHPAFAKSTSNLTGLSTPSENSSFSRAIPAIGTETTTTQTPGPGTLWTGHTENWSGGNWYNQAYGEGQARGYPSAEHGRRYVDDKEKRLYNWAPAGTQAYHSHRDRSCREDGWVVETRYDGNKQQSQASGTQGSAKFSDARKESQYQSQSQSASNNSQGQTQLWDPSQPLHRQPGSAAFPHGNRKDSVHSSPAKTGNGEGKSGGRKKWKNKGGDQPSSSSAAA